MISVGFKAILRNWTAALTEEAKIATYRIPFTSVLNSKRYDAWLPARAQRLHSGCRRESVEG